MSAESVSPAKRSRSKDPMAAILGYSIFAVIVLILVMALWVVATGVFNPPTPRSYHERQLDLLEQVVKQKPKSAAAWGDWVRALIESKQYGAAARVISRGEKALGKATPELAVEKARLAIARGDSDATALKLLDEALKVTEKHREQELAKLAEKAVVIDPREISGPAMADAAAMKGGLLAKEKKWSEAEKALTVALYERPQSADYLIVRGSIYIELREFAKAKADFQKALSFIPGFKPALDGLARVEKESGK